MPIPLKRRSHSHSTRQRQRQHHGRRDSHVRIDITTRVPMPLDRARPSVAQLPDHIVQQILGYLQESHPEDVLIVALLSSYLYEHARYVQHRVVSIDLDKSEHIYDRLDLITCRSLLPVIRTFEVGGRFCNELTNETQEILNRLAGVLSGMKGLRDFGWQVRIPIPLPILESLRPGVDLHTSVSCRANEVSHAQARKFLDRLADNMCLHTLSVQIEFIQERDCLETMRVLKTVLLSCPNLTRIPLLDIYYPRGQCQGYGPPLTGGVYCGLGLSAGERPQALEELGVHDYPWGIEGALYCQGYPERGHEWNYWAETFDWSRLVRLNYVPPIDLSAIVPKMTGLRQVILESHHWVEASFLDEITSPLNILSITGWSRVSSKSETINRHGATLQKLKIHQPERHWVGNAHDVVTHLDLIQLSYGLPHLEELALDLMRDESSTQWPYGALDALSNFPSLRTVELWFPLGTKPPAPTPILTVSSARHLFSYLRERNGNIQRLSLHSGAPSPPLRLHMFGSDLEPQYSWAEHTSVTFVCNIAYDVGAKDGRISVTCPDLSTEMNRRLDRLAQKGHRDSLDPRTLDKAGLRLKSALDGPLTKDEWEAWLDEQRIRERKEYLEQNSVIRKFIIGPFKRALER